MVYPKRENILTFSDRRGRLRCSLIGASLASQAYYYLGTSLDRGMLISQSHFIDSMISQLVCQGFPLSPTNIQGTEFLGRIGCAKIRVIQATLRHSR